MNGPELVLPAGDLEKVKTAVLFGADSVYMGGKEFSLRSFAGNLTMEEMAEGLAYVHQRGRKAAVAVNIFAHNRDIKHVPGYLEELQSLGVDALIISDPGVMRLALKYAPDIPITVSTQANVSNYESAAMYKDLGAERVVVARELSLDEIVEIKERLDMEIEVFVHGAMCVSYSGRCLLSHYMTGRSANQGACAHPCRYEYRLLEESRPEEEFAIQEDQRGSYILNSRDLCLIEYIPRLIDAGINAFKVEGRMKSPLYVATVARTYRQAIDKYLSDSRPYSSNEIQEYLSELNKVATRPFTNGFIEGESPEIMDINRQKIADRADFCGVVKAYHADKKLLEIQQRSNFGPGENLELLCPDGRIIKPQVKELFNEEGQLLDRARHPKQNIFIPCEENIEQFSILRRV